MGLLLLFEYPHLTDNVNDTTPGGTFSEPRRRYKHKRNEGPTWLVEAHRSRRTTMNRSLKITAAVVALLAVMYVSTKFTHSTYEDIIANRPKDNREANKQSAQHQDHSGHVALPKPSGPADAPVKLKVYITSTNDCDSTTLSGIDQIRKKYGAKLRIEFADLEHHESAMEAEKAKISCKTGVTLNGMSIVPVPGRGTRGLLMFDGPIGKNNYSLADVDAAVAYLLEKGKGGGGGKSTKGSDKETG